MPRYFRKNPDGSVVQRRGKWQETDNVQNGVGGTYDSILHRSGIMQADEFGESKCYEP